MKNKDLSLLVIEPPPPLIKLKERTLTVTSTAFQGISDLLLYLIIIYISTNSTNDYKKIDNLVSILFNIN